MIRPVFATTAWVPTRARYVIKGGRGPVRLPVRCALIDHPTRGPVMIDAGYGPQLTSDPDRSWALRLYAALLRPVLNPAESPLELLRAHGFAPQDVQTVIVTHLHGDHVAYLPAFENARSVTDGQTRGSLRHGVFNELLPEDFAARQDDLRAAPMAPLPFDMGQGYDLLGDASVLGVPLPGHAKGHFGLCFPGDRPLLYAADVQWMLAAVTEDRMPGFPLRMIAADQVALRESVAFTKRFAQAGGDVMLCHDPARTVYDWTHARV